PYGVPRGEGGVEPLCDAAAPAAAAGPEESDAEPDWGAGLRAAWPAILSNGRYSILLLLSASTTILAVFSRMCCMVDRYMRSRVMSGALAYSPSTLVKRAVSPWASPMTRARYPS